MSRAFLDAIGRAVLGAAAGAVGGAGVQLTWRSWILPGECFRPRGWRCGVWLDGDLFIYAFSWAIMAGLVLSGVLGLLKRPRAWTAFVLACGGWLVLWVATGLLGLVPDGRSLAVMLVVVHVAAGALSVPRPAFAEDEPSSSPHGEVTRGPT
ncbi:hypothetical protein [Lentzea sp. NPDC051838]|uniref:hypothetical protein n=1 Tax=Lentzea sp. NPDC051838 TaxID=3154849 RepID=UPI0034154655